MEQIEELTELKPVTLKDRVSQGAGDWPYACGGYVGGQGGTFFDYYAGAPNVGALDGRVVSKFEMWAGGWQIRGIRITLTDGSYQLYGSSDGAYNYFDFQPGELIQNLSLWGNGAGSRTGWIKFITNKGNTFDHGMTDWGKKKEYPMPVYSGVFCGISGWSGGDIDALGFVFFQPLSSIVISDVNYPDLVNYAKNIQPTTLDTYSNTNHGDQPRDWSWIKTLRKENQQSWSITKELELSQSVTVSAGIPEIAEVATTFTWRIGQSSTQSSSETIITEFVIGDSGTLEVGQSVNLAALVQQGSLVNIAYTGKITFNLKSGGSYTNSFSGVYSGVAYTGVVIEDLTTNQVVNTGSIRHFVA